MILLASRNLTPRELLLRALDLEKLPEIALGPHGKPAFPQMPHIHFNLSHSGELALCGVGTHPLGVDMEGVRPRGAHLPRYVLSGAEYRWYEANGGDWGAFYTLWTRKEAFCKQCGGSIYPARRIAPPQTPDLVSFSGDGWRAAVYAPGEKPAPLRWL